MLVDNTASGTALLERIDIIALDEDLEDFVLPGETSYSCFHAELVLVDLILRVSRDVASSSRSSARQTYIAYSY